MFDLSGKMALVTGASGGIGGAIARGLHAQGANVVLSGTREDALSALRAELGDRASVAPANLADGPTVDGLVAAAEAAAGAELDILVANAGITRDGLVLRMKDEDFEQVLKVNLESYFRLARSALRGMMRRRRGRIIGITSVVGVMGNAGQTNYAASKAGMIGFIESPMTDALNEAQKTTILGNVPLGRLGVGADVASACVYLASDEAAYVTGQTLHVNGGMAMI